MQCDYKKAYEAAYRKNVELVIKDAETGQLDIDRKIENFCENFGFTKQEVIEQICTNKIVAALFAKNPNTQNFYEKLAAEYISRIPGVMKFENLPNTALVVCNGGVIERKELKKTGGQSNAKTIDFKWEYKGNTFYAAHKYTKQSGGAQDNQYRDLIAFIKEARNCSLPATYFVAIADGEYYGTKNGHVDKTRMENLQSHCTANVFACRINELQNVMDGIHETKRP